MKEEKITKQHIHCVAEVTQRWSGLGIERKFRAIITDISEHTDNICVMGLTAADSGYFPPKDVVLVH